MTVQNHLSLSSLVLISALAVPGRAWSQAPGSFTPTGDMLSPRQDHTATLLNTGNVLIAGGVGTDNQLLTSAELYDPTTGTFSQTGSLSTARFRHSAVLLPDGTVLIVGGSSDGSAEIYDPSAGVFTSLGNLVGGSYPIYRWTTATLLSTGKVLITMGTAPPSASRIAGIYDPSTGAFTPTGDMIYDHLGPKATLLSNGNVLIVEGRDPACETVYPAGACGGGELYDPADGAFHPVEGITGEPWRGAPSSNLLMDGRVLAAGGDGGNGILDSTDIFDPRVGRFAGGPNLTLPRLGHTGVILSDGTVLIVGGATSNIGLQKTAELYDPSTNRFVATGTMATPRSDLTATLLPDGSVLVAGADQGYATQPSAEIFHPAAPLPPPALLSLSGDGTGQAAVQHADTYQLVSPDNPARAGEVIVIYCVGLNNTSVIPSQVAIGGRLAEVLFFGNTPGYPGLYQINVRVPSGTASGPIVPLRLNYLGRPSNETTISIQ
jgi:hypothetical protein